MIKLTKRTVDGLLATHDGRDRFFWDEEIKGFGLRINPSGVAAWLVQYRTVHGRTRRLTLGAVSVVTPEQARQRARIELGRVEQGYDPSGERKAIRAATTVSQLCDEYLEAGKGRIKDSTLKMDRSRIDRHVKPLLGNRAVTSLTPGEIERFMRDVIAGKTAKNVAEKNGRPRGGQTSGGSGVAARTVGMLGTILERAVRDGSIQRNPVRGVSRPKDRRYRPTFSFELIERLGEGLRVAEAEKANASGLGAIKILLLTGCRREEILALRWSEVDLQNRCVRFPDTKTGPQVRPIGRAAVDAILALPRAEGAVFLLPSNRTKGHFVGLPKVWRRVLERANLEYRRPHTLRHWFSSAAAEMNYSELTIAGLIGHHGRGVTARYANAPDSALLAAADRVSARIAEALFAPKADIGNVIDFQALRQ
jgi:site-specific recombinase XerD